MTTTLEEIKAEHARLATLIAGLERAQPRTLSMNAIEITLTEGEIYAGLILNDDATPSHHLVLLPGDTTASWDDAKAWAQGLGGELPTRREQSLLFANAKAGFQPRYYWSSEAHEDGSCAWMQDFGYGSQGWINVDYKTCARAVRRVSA
jgi:hypothetical protein